MTQTMTDYESGHREPEGSERERRFDLEERTARFGEAIIRFAKQVPITPVTTPLIGQLAEAGTSVGAN